MTDKAQEIADLIEELEGEFGVEIEVTGGGRGWAATATEDGVAVDVAKESSKLSALQVLQDGLAAWQMNGNQSLEEIEAEEIEGCSDECQSSESAFCQCACDGANHGANITRTEPFLLVVIGNKPCKCGCGEITKRQFAAGHDARYHGLVALREWAVANSVTGTDEELRKAKAASLRKAARERRAAKRAGEQVIAEAMIATIKADSRPSAKQVAANVAVAKETEAALEGLDSLPF